MGGAGRGRRCGRDAAGPRSAVLPGVRVLLRVVEAVAAASDAHRAACEGEQEEDYERDPEACGAASAVSHWTSVIGTVMMDNEQRESGGRKVEGREDEVEKRMKVGGELKRKDELTRPGSRVRLDAVQLMHLLLDPAIEGDVGQECEKR